MEGSFKNITCIDEVHLNINSKVNEVMRDFIGKIGKDVCMNATDVTLELKSGNIRFKGAKAQIFIQFCLKYSTSVPRAVESCAEDFKVHVLDFLPAKFELVSSQVVPESCQLMSYVPGSTNVTHNAWSCPKGYELDTVIFKCKRSILTSFSTLPAATPTPSATSPPVPVDTIPRMVLPFSGVFLSDAGYGASRIKDCLPEYRAGLLALLSDLESHVQNYHEKCGNIYVDITGNLTLTRHGLRILAQSTVLLVPLANTIDLPAMYLCGGFIMSEFQHPLNHLPNVTLPGSYLVNCSAITLEPSQLNSNNSLVSFICPEGYLYDVSNFLCISEALPSYALQVELSITKTQRSCRQVLQVSAGTLAQHVVEDVHLRLHSGQLCNSSAVRARVVLRPRNSTLSLTNTQATISIPFVLLSMDGQVLPVERCKNELYGYLASSLAAPVSAVMANISAACPSAVGPQNYTVTSEEWVCAETRVYNAQLHTCDKFGALEESITKTKGLMSERRRRDTYHQNLVARPYWNATLPTCRDHEAPVFTACPRTSVEVKLGPGGPEPVNISLPSVTDNSGSLVTVTYQPEDFRLPYTFRHNMSVNITATDPAGNERVCTIAVILVDVTPPEIQCPTRIHRQHYNSTGNTVALVYPPDLVTAKDSSGISHYILDPPPGSKVYVMQEFLITATAFDPSGNSASCSFVYIAETDRCPLWTLPTPDGGDGPACTGTVEGSVGFGMACQVSCKPDYEFIIPPPKLYICVNGSQWSPDNKVPDCSAKTFPNYDLHITQNFTYDGLKTQSCSQDVGSKLLSQLRESLDSTCASALNYLSFKVLHMGSFDMQDSKYTLKMKVEIRQDATVRVEAAHNCGEMIKSEIDNFKLSIAADGCGNASIQLPSEIHGQDTCPAGSTFVGTLCFECTAGTFMNQTTGSCQPCPLGYYQDQRGQENCTQCPAGTTTLSTATKTSALCKAKCGRGFYSSTGLEPCVQCPRGHYQPDFGTTFCLPCDDGRSTEGPGCTNKTDCKVKCSPGMFSATGVHPCAPCPMNYYSSEAGATYCTECHPSLVTVTVGSTSQSDCLAVDQCQNQPCAAGASCVNHHRFYQCLCPPGHTGVLCDKTVNECDSQPCVNGGVCSDGVDVNSYTCDCPAGYEGRNCEFGTDECNPDPCVHGLCVDQHLTFTCRCHAGYKGERCDVDIDDCAEAPCQNGGICLDLVAGFQCDCSGTGFAGRLCEAEVDECRESSCLNGATCTDLINGFLCTCQPGFNGESCEHNIDDCNPNPCHNGAVCLDGANSSSCICQPGYTGPHCDQEVDECMSSPCKNGAACTDVVNGFTCDCPEGFEGKRCEVDVNDCAAEPCNALGTAWCEDGVNSFTCHCQEYWQGTLCETQMDPCVTTPCASGATCSAVGRDFICTCPVDVTGTLCDVQIDECASGPCMNNGTCIDGVQVFTCDCDTGFTGDLCDVSVDECVSQPCQNGGTCIDLVNGYTCSCAPGYKGLTCGDDIDDCTSQPCRNGGICSDLVDNFKCHCPSGYSGKTCSVDINECDGDPCQNGGTCIDLTGSSECICPPGYSGEFCQDDPCVTANTCLNGATCIVDQGDITCLCPVGFTGSDCGKAKSGDYDLQFLGKNGSACRPPGLTLLQGSQLTVCLWLRFASSVTKGTYLTLSSDSDDEYVMLKMSGNMVSVSLAGEKNPRLLELNLRTDGWHHVCYQWASGRHSVFEDGGLSEDEDYGQDVVLPDSVTLMLGQPHTPSSGQPFQGEISQVNVFSKPLAVAEIEAMGRNCSAGHMQGDVYAWVVSDAYLEGDVAVVTPAMCGGSQCPPGFHGTFCDSETDKVPPTVVSYPGDMSVVNTSVLVQVEWVEPVFTDNVGIIRTQQTHRSGQAFRHGEYVVRYVAYDAENNSAECSFEVVVKPFSCVEPPAPVNGGKVCQTWLHGSFCSIKCLPAFEFVELPPPFYTCGKLGFWDPPRGNPFRFPPCTAMQQPLVSLIGRMEMTGPRCSQEFKAALKSGFTDRMKQLDQTLGLCLTDRCDFENGFIVTCDVERRRRRRREAADTYVMRMNMTMPANSSALQKEDGNWAAEAVTTAVKCGEFDDDTFTAEPGSLQLAVDYQCQLGQVLRTVQGETTTRTCLDCPPGYFYNRESSNCELCPEASYSDEPRQLQCKPCPSGTTTNAPGSSSSDNCFALCPVGQYYSMSDGQCLPCPSGQYQDTPGQTACWDCPLGQSTKNPGATNVEQCDNVCDLGHELASDGVCRPCPVGSYQDTRETPICQPCPYGWTTPDAGATSVASCTIVVCQQGSHYSEDNHCTPCPVGTYQPARGAENCIPCGVGLTTQDQGARGAALCIPGSVDECRTGSHECHVEAECVDLPDEYYCICNPGYTGDGFNCTDVCEGYCGENGECGYGVSGDAVCSCKYGYTGPRCSDIDFVSESLNSAIAGGVAGSVVAVVVIFIISAVCYWRHRTQVKESHDRIYRSHHRLTPAAFYNEGYESIRDSISMPSQLIVREQDSSSSSASSLSIAPRWNRCTFANSDELLLSIFSAQKKEFEDFAFVFA
nr:hypothetical protein BaRGS_024727 [Batillaria attramentaria]